MTHLWLLRFAPLILATLLLGTPRVVTATEIGSAAQPTGVAPAVELWVKAVFARAASREPVRGETTPFAAAAPVWLSPQRAHGTLAAPEPRKPAACSARSRQPPARAPPDLF